MFVLTTQEMGIPEKKREKKGSPKTPQLRDAEFEPHPKVPLLVQTFVPAQRLALLKILVKCTDQ